MRQLIRYMSYQPASQVQLLQVRISMFFGCTLMAPHGGIFVFPVVGNALMYLVALVVGTAVSTVLLGLLKKKVA